MFNFIYYQLLLLQLEEYDVVRFLKAFFAKPLPPKIFRKKLVFTQKILTLISLSLLISVFLISTIYYLLTPAHYLLFLIWYLIIFFSYLPLLLVSYFLIFPIDYLIKFLIVFFATKKIAQFPKIIIIGIAGSYGKTSFKEMLFTILSQKFNVVKTPESFNTPLGISQTILKKLNQNTQIFIVEMGEYYPGDIKKICQIAKPNIAIITGINEAHLERLKTLQNTVATIFEVAQNMEQKGLLILNEKNELIKKHFSEFIKSQEVYLYGNQYKQIKDIQFREDLPGYSIDFSGLCLLSILGEYNLYNLDAIIYLAQKLKMTDEEIKESINKIKPVPHRLQPLFNRQNNILMIDDSYNGNPHGVEEAIKTLSLFKRRKIYVTPGLVEMGKKKQQVHEQIGKSLAKVADLVILTKNSVTPYIEKSLLKNNFAPEKIVTFHSGNETYAKLGKILQSGDVILLQNDWPDNYQ